MLRVWTVLLLALALLVAAPLPAVSYASAGEMTADNGGANGAVRGEAIGSKPGSAQLVLHNEHEFWTTIDLPTLSGVTLQPGAPELGGPYAALGVIPPKDTASWQAKWNPRQTVQVYAVTTPYIAHTKAGPLAAGLTFLTIIAELVPGYDKAKQAVGAAPNLLNAYTLARQYMGDDLDRLVTIEGLTSGRFGEALWAGLRAPQKVEVLRQALELFGVTVSTATLKQLLTTISIIKMSQIAFDLAWTLGTQTSTGGVVFSSLGTGGAVTSTTTRRPPASSKLTTTLSTVSPAVRPTAISSVPKQTSVDTATVIRRQTVAVPAASPWTDSGVDVAAGDHLYIKGSGVIQVAGSDPGKEPNGRTVGNPPQLCTAASGFNEPGLECHALLARIGQQHAFAVLAAVSQTVTTSGRLYLGVNDDDFSDNSGSWRADVKVCRGGSLQHCVSE